MTWTKYSYVCTNCDGLLEITTQAIPTIDPACNCSPSAWITHTAMEPEQLPPVISITPSNVVKINSNPYN